MDNKIYYNTAGGFNYKYHINPEKRIIVCEINTIQATFTTDNLLSSLISKKINNSISSTHKNNLIPFPISIDTELAYDKTTFIGKAKCSPEDTFNEEYGKFLAYTKAVKKLYKYRISALKQLKNMLRTAIDSTEDLTTTLENRTIKLQHDLLSREPK